MEDQRKVKGDQRFEISNGSLKTHQYVVRSGHARSCNYSKKCFVVHTDGRSAYEVLETEKSNPTNIPATFSDFWPTQSSNHVVNIVIVLLLGLTLYFDVHFGPWYIRNLDVDIDLLVFRRWVKEFCSGDGLECQTVQIHKNIDDVCKNVGDSWETWGCTIIFWSSHPIAFRGV